MANVPNRTPGESEFSHGPGLRPAHLVDKLPSDGGMYRGKSPEVGPNGRQRPS